MVDPMSTAALPSAALTPPVYVRWVAPLAALALSGSASVIALVAAGPLQGALFGSCIVTVLLTPLLVSSETRWPMALLVTVSLAVGCLLGPIAAVLQGELNGRLLSVLAAVAAPLVLALAGVTFLLNRLRLPGGLAAALISLIALAWLSWPIWLSPWLAGNEALVSQLSPAHPLLTIDAAITREGGVPWSEHRLMYSKLTVLGQHVFPRPPIGVGAAALLHGAIGGAAFIPVIVVQLWKSRRQRRDDWDEFEAM